MARRWERIARLLLNQGDTLLVEEWTYVFAMAAAHPIESTCAGNPSLWTVKVDALREILAGWDVEKDGPRCASSWLQFAR